MLVLWMLRGIMLTPVHKGKNTRISVNIFVSGPEPGLEQTVDGLCWLGSNGTLPASITVVDAGMDGATRDIAKTLAKDGHIKLRTGPEN